MNTGKVSHKRQNKSDKTILFDDVLHWCLRYGLTLVPFYRELNIYGGGVNPRPRWRAFFTDLSIKRSAWKYETLGRGDLATFRILLRAGLVLSGDRHNVLPGDAWCMFTHNRRQRGLQGLQHSTATFSPLFQHLSWSDMLIYINSLAYFLWALSFYFVSKEEFIFFIIKKRRDASCDLPDSKLAWH